MEYCITISPDPKRKNGKKEYGALAPRKQYVSLVHNISSICAKIKLIHKYYFIFEISGNGNIHSHGSIFVDQTINNSHKLAIKSFQHAIGAIFARSGNTQHYIDICCKVKERDDTIVSDKFKTWDDYLQKEQKGLPKFMMPIDSTNIANIREMINEDEEKRINFLKNFKPGEFEHGILIDFE